MASLPVPGYLQPQDGHGADDIDIGLPRKRSRRISTASVATLRSQRSDDAYSELIENDLGIRPYAPPIRHRHSQHVRSPSFASSIRARSSSGAASFLEPYAESPTMATLNATPSQRILEQIISSRLVETFITLSALPMSDVKGARGATESDSIKSRESLDIPKSSSPRRTVIRGSSSASPSRIISKTSVHRTQAPDRLRSASIRDSIAESQSAPSTSFQFPSTSSPSPSMTDSISPDIQDIPFFMSSFHRPSTNPSWTTLEPKNDFAPDTDLRMSKIRAILWGQKQPSSRSMSISLKGVKGKEREANPPGPSWQKLVEWNVDFGQLRPFTPDVGEYHVVLLIVIP